MKRKAVIFIAVVLSLVVSQAHRLIAQPPRARDEVRTDLTRGAGASVGWYAFATDTVGSATRRLVTYGTFKQLSVADTLRIRSDTGTDSTNLVLIGILSSDSTRFKEKLRVSGTDSVWSTKKWLHFEQAVCDTESAGTITIYGKTTGALAIIVPGDLKSYAAHRFMGNKDGGLMSWAVLPDTTTLMVDTQLRWYPDAADAGQTPETGYITLDRCVFPANTGTNLVRNPFFRTFDPPIFLLRRGYLAAFSRTTSTPSRISVSISGYDSR